MLHLYLEVSRCIYIFCNKPLCKNFNFAVVVSTTYITTRLSLTLQRAGATGLSSASHHCGVIKGKYTVLS